MRRRWPWTEAGIASRSGTPRRDPDARSRSRSSRRRPRWPGAPDDAANEGFELPFRQGSPGCLTGEPSTGVIQFCDKRGRWLREIELEPSYSMYGNAIVFTSDSRHVLVATPRQVHVFATGLGNEVERIDRSWAFMHRLPSGHILAGECQQTNTVFMSPHRLVVWDPDHAEVVHHLDLEYGATSLTIAGNGQRALVQHRDRLRLIEISEGSR